MFFLYNLTSQTRHLATIVVFVPSSTSLLKLHLIYHVGSQTVNFRCNTRFSLQKSNPTSRCPTNRNQPNPHGASLCPKRGSVRGTQNLRTHLEWNHLAGLYLWFHVVTSRCGETVIFFCTPKKVEKNKAHQTKRGPLFQKGNGKKQQWNMNTEFIVYTVYIKKSCWKMVFLFLMFFLQDDNTWFKYLSYFEDFWWGGTTFLLDQQRPKPLRQQNHL